MINADEGLRAILLQTLGFDDDHIGGYPGLDLRQKLDYISIEIVGGGADRFEMSPVVDIDVFSARRSQAKNIANQVSLTILRYPVTVRIGGEKFIIDSATCISLPAKRPWDDEKVRRQSATYQLSIRR